MKKALLLFLFITSTLVFAQTELVFVYFKDKPNKAAFYANPFIELSKKSLDRRKALGIPLNDQDAPIEQSYIQNIRNLGFMVADYSKWLNGVAINANASQVQLLLNQPYVKSIESFAKNSSVVVKKTNIDKWKTFNELQTTAKDFNYGSGLEQIEQVNIKPLHIAGFTGNGISIAVLDTGFPTVDTGSTYQYLRDNNKIKGTYNFISKSNAIYDTTLNTHGAVVLGAIGGYMDGEFVGSAPDANFYLYATEDGSQEIPEEQIYWIEAAEEADRQGVDIITSSLGYYVFDNPIYDYTYEDMNGVTTFISRGAQIAAEKGIFVLTAVGNSAQNSWHYLLAPADNSKVFTIGGVDANGDASSFSSFGPNASGIIKPDGLARGTATVTVYDNSIITSSGTSLATPVAAGGVACLLQALSQKHSMEEVRQKLRENASLYPNPTDQKGYGILNFWKTYETLKNEINPNSSFFIYPNPTQDLVYIKTNEIVQNVEVYDVLGRLMMVKKINHYAVDLSQLKTGVYFLKFKISDKTFIEKLIKE